MVKRMHACLKYKNKVGCESHCRSRREKNEGKRKKEKKKAGLWAASPAGPVPHSTLRSRLRHKAPLGSVAEEPEPSCKVQPIPHFFL